MPDTRSVPRNETTTGARYHPFPSGGRLGAAPVTMGTDLSTLTVAVAQTQLMLSSVTPHCHFVTPSVEIVVATGQLFVLTAVGENHLSTVLVVCQPLQSNGAGVQL